MRILMLHNRYLRPGGEDISFQMEVELLRSNGDEVVVYEENNTRIADVGRFRTGLRAIWSIETYLKLRKILRDGRFDVMHVQNFFPLISPSAYYAAASAGVPVVQSLRNYRLECLPGTLFRNGAPCETCHRMAVPWAGVWHRCYRDSVWGSTSVALMIGINKLFGTWRNKIDMYVVLTDFQRDRYVQTGLPEDKIIRKYNFVHPTPEVGRGEGGYALFIGRFDTVKGIDTLLAAWESLDTSIPLKIVGDGPLAERVDAYCRQAPNAERLGWQSTDEVLDLIGNAKFVIAPSRFYEPFGRIVAESFAKGTPVIAANIGGLGELIDDGRTGFLFEANNAQDLAAKIKLALDDDGLLQKMRDEARSDFNAEFSADVNYPQLKHIYKSAIAARNGQTSQGPTEKSLDAR